MISKALVVGPYQAKAELLARYHDVALTVVVPLSWRDERGELVLEREHTTGYDLRVTRVAFNGRYHFHFYPEIGKIAREVHPDILHIDEEPYNYATFHALWQGLHALPNLRVLFFTWQNLFRQYPLPFRLMEQYAYHHSQYALAGNTAAADVLRRKGFARPVRVIPQFGVDPDVYHPSSSSPPGKRFTVGYAGRLVPEKGVDLLLRALSCLEGDWELQVAGNGPERERLQTLARELGLESRARFMPWLSSRDMPGFYRGLDVLVAPSLTRPNWSEQFGRVIVEAMASGVCVVGSSSGEIPDVIGDAGIIFPEGDETALTRALDQVRRDAGRRSALGEQGRTRVIQKYTQERIAAETYLVYCEMTRSK